MNRRPYAIMLFVDKVSVYAAAQKGHRLTEGYFMSRARYGSAESAWKQADYTNRLSGERHPSYVVVARTGERVERPKSQPEEK